MSLEAILKWDSGLIIVPIAVLITGFFVTFVSFMASRNGAVLKRGLMVPVAALIVFNYYLAYRSIFDIMTKYAQFDLILPVYGLAILMMFPFTLNFLKLTWTGIGKIVSNRPLTVDEVTVNKVLEKLKECENMGIITGEVLEICRAHLSSISQPNS